MITRNLVHAVFLTVILITAGKAQSQTNQVNNHSEIVSHGPTSITRNIIQDRKGNIWMASWQGVFKYDGRSFINVTNKVSSARFFSVIEDKKGNFWFSSVGSGVYHYNGKSFKNFRTKDGLASDRVTALYEDKSGNIWFSTEAGASRYDGKSFRSFKMSEAPLPTEADSMHVSAYQGRLPADHWTHNDINAVIEDKTGKFWIATRGYTRIFDGGKITTVTNKDGKPFTNVRSIIEDKKGNIWLGGNDGLWRYDGKTFTNFTRKFVGHVIEDKKGNIWTSSESANNLDKALTVNGGKTAAWALSFYDALSLSDKKPVATEITHNSMIFGILEDNRGGIWFGAVDGVYRYDGNTTTKF